MSADNYYLVRRDGARFVVSQGCDSATNDPDVRADDPRFDTFEAAALWADSRQSEYGVRFDVAPTPPPVTLTPDDVLLGLAALQAEGGVPPGMGTLALELWDARQVLRFVVAHTEPHGRGDAIIDAARRCLPVV